MKRVEKREELGREENREEYRADLVPASLIIPITQTVKYFPSNKGKTLADLIRRLCVSLIETDTSLDGSCPAVNFHTTCSPALFSMTYLA